MPLVGWRELSVSSGTRSTRGSRRSSCIRETPTTRVDVLRSTRTVRIELEGVVLAESSAPVMVFETGLPTRYYLDREAVNLEHLVPTNAVSSCP